MIYVIAALYPLVLVAGEINCIYMHHTSAFCNFSPNFLLGILFISVIRSLNEMAKIIVVLCYLRKSPPTSCAKSQGSRRGGGD